MFYGIPRAIVLGALIGIAIALFISFVIIKNKMTKRSLADKAIAVAMWSLMLGLIGALVGFGVLFVLEHTVYENWNPIPLTMLPLHYPDQTVREKVGDFYNYDGFNGNGHAPLKAEIRSSETSYVASGNINRVVVFPRVHPAWLVWLGAKPVPFSSFHHVFLIKQADAGN